ncbi:FAD binding domain-containing protein [Bradyrhizobium sp.]|uniref:FAD binding domain-containing protein n=1 Tax=Bradyrhizobium sp. TaxID=376 RepID=UPI002D5328E6|nr:FAD binding domain-containing protein [Bradyrhizobium sp.]HZR76801.1 FAD binding domain-containing protein [Bradyrhizobium sp.]
MSNGTASASAPLAEFRAAGTDLSERRRSGVSRGPLTDLVRPAGAQDITWDENGAARINAFATIATLAADARLASAYPGVNAAAGGLATPQIRHVATLGGNLAQRSRCWYFRDPHIPCLKKGGDSCPARDGNHLYGVVFDLGPCVAPHPSTMAAALMAYDATVTTNRRQGLGIAALLGDGSNGRADNLLAPGEIVESIDLGVPVAGERALYRRAISRSYAEWPLVEVVVRAVIADGTFKLARIVAGGIAPVPLRLTASESLLHGAAVNATAIGNAVAQSTVGAKPLAMTGYKLDLLRGLLRDQLERIIA